MACFAVADQNLIRVIKFYLYNCWSAVWLIRLIALLTKVIMSLAVFVRRNGFVSLL